MRDVGPRFIVGPRGWVGGGWATCSINRHSTVCARFGIILLAGLLIALQFVLPAVAFAALARVAPNPPEATFARAEVSVVRLLVTYKLPSSAQLSTPITSILGQSPVPSPVSSQVVCTGLGILVGSWAVKGTNSAPYVNWVLTDPALVNPSTPVCVQNPAPGFSLANIDVLANEAYTNTDPSDPQALQHVLTLGSLSCQGTATSCQSSGVPSTFLPSFGNVNGSAILFSFRSKLPQPFVVVATQDQTPNFAIRLTDASNKASLLPLSARNLPQSYLKPVAVLLTSSSTQIVQEEPGTPMMNAAGQVVSIQAGSGPLPVTQANTLLQKQPPLPTPSQRTNTNLHTNPLQEAWNAGIEDFYGGPNHAAATQEFALATKANPAFKAPAMVTNGNGFGQASPIPGIVPTPAVSYQSSFFGNPWLLLGIGLLGLIILLVGTGLLLRARAHRKELARFEAERHEAELKVQPQQQAQQAQGATPVNKASPSRPTPVPEAPKVLNTPAQPQSQLSPSLPRQAAATVNVLGTTKHVQTASDLRCPNCGRFVQVGATYCPNCRYQLSSVEARFIAPVEAPHAIGTVGEMPRKDERNDAESVGARSIAPAGPGGAPTVPQAQEVPVEAMPENASVEARLRRLWNQSE